VLRQEDYSKLRGPDGPTLAAPIRPIPKRYPLRLATRHCSDTETDYRLPTVVPVL